MSNVNDYSEIVRTDEHFANARAQALALEAETLRTEQAARMATLNNERIRRIGLAALPIGAGVALALFGASFLFAGHEHVVSVPGPERVVTRDVPGPERIIHDAPLPPHRPVAETPLAPPYAPKTPEEKPFTEKPEYKDATYHGRVIKSIDGRVLSFADGQNFRPCHIVTGKCVTDETRAYDSDAYVGDLGMCVPDKQYPDEWYCSAFHDNQEVNISQKPVPKSEQHASPTADTINVDIDIAGYPAKAMVDTGCTYPLALPDAIADLLIRDGRAIFAGTSKTLLADGNVTDGRIILIKSITVNGRIIDRVEASVSPSNNAPVLLGMGALNRLGAFNITDGKIVFTGEQPT